MSSKLELILLLPEQATALWDRIKQTMVVSSPNAALLNGSSALWLEAIMKGTSQVWLGLEDDKPKCLCVTAIHNNISGIRVLDICALESFYLIPEEMWSLGKRTLLSFAKENQCKYIVGVTRSAEIMNRFFAIGAQQSFLYELEVK